MTFGAIYYTMSLKLPPKTSSLKVVVSKPRTIPNHGYHNKNHIIRKNCSLKKYIRKRLPSKVTTKIVPLKETLQQVKFK